MTISSEKDYSQDPAEVGTLRLELDSSLRHGTGGGGLMEIGTGAILSAIRVLHQDVKELKEVLPGSPCQRHEETTRTTPPVVMENHAADAPAGTPLRGELKDIQLQSAIEAQRHE